MKMNLGKLWETEEGRAAWQLQSMGSQRVEHDSVTELQRRWSLDDLSQGLAWPRVNCLMLICLSVRGVCVCVCVRVCVCVWVCVCVCVCVCTI